MKNRETIEIVKESRKAGIQAALIAFGSLVCALIGIISFMYIVGSATNISAKTTNGNNYIQSR